MMGPDTRPMGRFMVMFNRYKIIGVGSILSAGYGISNIQMYRGGYIRLLVEASRSFCIHLGLQDKYIQLYMGVLVKGDLNVGTMSLACTLNPAPAPQN